MSFTPPEQQPEDQADTAAAEGLSPSLSEREHLDLADASTQAKYRAAYLEQLRRRACPGCGEGDILG